ncbi:hypothetical protein CEXT_35651 [Caerostris extrusa]|uniref:Uncharacterized protein n=1 Tax=Caerostris extrusa TaxID=172846 RepID=A0AAV4NZ24_CAEEX|nr:hypothetical protein CEXT_35651 [Caerostris extrusa]
MNHRTSSEADTSTNHSLFFRTSGKRIECLRFKIQNFRSRKKENCPKRRHLKHCWGYCPLRHCDTRFQPRSLIIRS